MASGARRQGRQRWQRKVVDLMWARVREGERREDGDGEMRSTTVSWKGSYPG
jgi:hypothetical protein